MKPGAATVWRPLILRLPDRRREISDDLPTATNFPSSTAIAASRMTRRSASTVISQSMSAISRSTDCKVGMLDPPGHCRARPGNPSQTDSRSLIDARVKPHTR
jgi:hypothetical protein